MREYRTPKQINPTIDSIRDRKLFERILKKAQREGHEQDMGYYCKLLLMRYLKIK